jgi:hypothetical protein
MEIAIQRLAMICFLIIGLSHVLQARAWAEFFIYLRGKGVTGTFIVAFIHLPMGVLVVAFHNVWHGIPIILTLFGWGWVLKCFLYFVFPKVADFGLSRIAVERAHEFRVPGFLFILVAFALGYHQLVS